MDLKLKIIGYGSNVPPSEVERAVNGFMSQVQVEDVQVVPFLASVVLHIFYYGEEPTHVEPEDEQGKAEGPK